MYSIRDRHISQRKNTVFGIVKHFIEYFVFLAARFARKEVMGQVDRCFVVTMCSSSVSGVISFPALCVSMKCRKKLAGREVFVVARLKLRNDDITKSTVKNEQFKQMAFGDGDLCPRGP